MQGNESLADSFEGEVPLQAFTQNIQQDREQSKNDEYTKIFYEYMHGEDWEKVVDQDTTAIIKHEKEIRCFFHKDLRTLQPDIFLIGSKEDEFVTSVDPLYFENIYGKMIKKIGYGSFHLFDTGRHPAILSNQDSFYELSMEFLTL